ncbi:hypothetical protein PPSIR1_14610 [Plesiocystis pacifica SIR-1]|uniref:DUF692 domain-containing protein n=1 Tax=Plesiocystis pacifica SIR-1 TaxID=391625 RepID=A6GFB5_9BACT|nr:DUF692 domain-containing protein [Plesiocystis pacifica]EDM75456.1 hypothetical protein PPSIR1_14610 [Plesiocystis pacifica SIR-1]
MARLSSDLPCLGVGLGFRRELREPIFEHIEAIDVLEIVADHFFNYVPEGQTPAVELAEKFPLLPHGLELNIGAHGDFDPRNVEEAVSLTEAVSAPWYSDHLCFTQAQGLEIGQLTPLPHTRATVERCVAKARAFQDQLGVPFLLENITRAFPLPGEMDEVSFVRAVIEGADCGLLLDLTNLFINAHNFEYDAYAYLDELPLERVVQIHLAGSVRRGERWMDSHSHSIEEHPEVWELLDYVAQRTRIGAVIIERDQNYPDDFGELLADIRTAQSILGKPGSLSRPGLEAPGAHRH